MIFGKKLRTDGCIEEYKARLVPQGIGQKAGIDFLDTYSPVAHTSTIRVLLALVSIHKLFVHQMDVETAFLHGDVDGEIYMTQRDGFIVPGQEGELDGAFHFYSHFTLHTRAATSQMFEPILLLLTVSNDRARSKRNHCLK